ncbi:MAG TPA: CpaF family protein [Oligoflexia bacterium]|nr:CpaF family protein [Oligoflexia bacterium]HMR25416.1 CpaF family protein [Oligoflexia bacterium]
MREHIEFIQNTNQYLKDHLFAKQSLEQQNKQQIKALITQCYYDFCYKNPQYKTLAGHKQLLSFIVHENLGLGAIDNLLQTEDVSEIMINGANCIYYEQYGKLHLSQLFFSSEQVLRNIINKIVSQVNRRLDQSSPMIDARLPDGSRLNAIIHPLVLNGTTVTIRRFLHKKISLEELINQQSLSIQSANFLKFCVQHKKNILIAGGTGSGKTTLLNILSQFIPASERIISIEDSAELKLNQPHVIQLETRTKNTENLGEVTIRDLLKNSLRMRPDRIIVGECRSEETIDMLQAMNTGHSGSMTTIHANSPRDAIKRIENLVLLSGYSFPSQALREQIISSIDLIIFIQRNNQGKRILTHITEVSHMEEGNISLLDIFKLEKGLLKWCRYYPNFLQKLSESQKKQLRNILSVNESQL